MEKQRILLVDDVPANVDILRRLLRKHYETDSAASGEECLRKMPRFCPHLVLLDIMMPGIDGYETCRRIKADPASGPNQVILVSGKGSTAERLRGYEAQADDYIVKPFDHDELLSKVRVHLRLLSVQRELLAAKEQLQTHADDLERLVQQRTVQWTSTQEMTVFALAQLADSRDPETGEHLYRMRHYAQTLAVELGRRGPYRDLVNETFLQHLYRSSPLHDIGKVGVPDAILLKPGRLTAEEFDVIKKHVLIGGETLERAREYVGPGTFMDVAAEIARYHHERFDGSGYCAGLRGTDIPLAARIVAVADVFDALTSPRVYKAAMPADQARELILKDAGSHFDPVIVEAFGECFAELCNCGTAIKPWLASPPEVSQSCGMPPPLPAPQC
jgi:response regulator RpfG family c-di-GMP phosphodiesterase